MMGNKQKLTGDAVDMVRFRGMYLYLERAGNKKKIKRRLHKDIRRECSWKKEHDMEDCNYCSHYDGDGCTLEPTDCSRYELEQTIEYIEDIQ